MNLWKRFLAIVAVPLALSQAATATAQHQADAGSDDPSSADAAVLQDAAPPTAAADPEPSWPKQNPSADVHVVKDDNPYKDEPKSAAPKPAVVRGQANGGQGEVLMYSNDSEAAIYIRPGGQFYAIRSSFVAKAFETDWETVYTYSGNHFKDFIGACFEGTRIHLDPERMHVRPWDIAKLNGPVDTAFMKQCQRDGGEFRFALQAGQVIKLPTKSRSVTPVPATGSPAAPKAVASPVPAVTAPPVPTTPVTPAPVSTPAATSSVTVTMSPPMVTPIATPAPTASATPAATTPVATAEPKPTAKANRAGWISNAFLVLLVCALAGIIAAGVYSQRRRLKVDFYRFWLPVRDYVASAWQRARATVHGWLGWDAGPPGIVDPDPFPPPGGGGPSGPPGPGPGTASPPPAGSGSASAPTGPPAASGPPASADPPGDPWRPSAKAKTMPGFAPPGAEPTAPFPFGFDPARQMGVFDPPKTHAGKQPKKSVVVNMGGKPTGPDEPTDLIGFPGGPSPPAPPDLDDPAALDDPGGAPDR